MNIESDINRWLSTWAPHCGAPKSVFEGQFAVIRKLIESSAAPLDFMEDLKWRYSHDEIEAACGGELALKVRKAVMKRREAILKENEH